MKGNSDQIAIYSRKSRFTGKGESIGNQIELCKDYIRTNYDGQLAEQAVVYEDEGFSGGNLNRPAFKKMMTAARERRFQAIVVYRLDRISRNISDFSSLIEELSRLEISFVSIKEQFDTGTPMGRAMMYIASVFSQLERETIAERIRDNMQELAKTGRWLGGVTPTGYTSEHVKSITVDGKAKKACRLKVISEEAELVKRIYDLYRETDSLTQTEAELLRQRVQTKTGRNFTRFSIKAILENPVYLIADEDAYRYFVERQAEIFSALSDFDGVHGVLAYNRTKQVKGKTSESLPVNEWIISVGQHPGIIPSREWIQVQQSLERNRSKAYRKPRSNEALLTGLLYCRCGGRMYPKLSNRETAEGRRSYTYMCKVKESSRKNRCACGNVSGNALDQAIMEQIGSLHEDSAAFLMELERSKSLYAGKQEPYEEELANLRAEQSFCARKMSALVDSLADMTDNAVKGHVVQRIKQLHRSGEELSLRIAEVEQLTAQQMLSKEEFASLCRSLMRYEMASSGVPLQQKREMVRTLISKVIWDGEHAHLIWFGASEEGGCIGNFNKKNIVFPGDLRNRWCEDSK